ncbi:cystinosin-like [Chironomus tepperi]|uniref:cystinosin-like n=1 Tax=Chironomus tepperi TaxID=113505 RepID=UPI00391F6827
MNKLHRIFFIIFISFIRLKANKTEELPMFEVLWAPDVLIVGESHEILLNFRSQLNKSVAVSFNKNQPHLINWSPKLISVPQNSPNFTIKIDAKRAGSVEVTGTSSPKDHINDFNLFFKIAIANSRGLIITSVIVGWIYFVSWSINSYPQIWLNFKRKSVIGLSFDFLAHNMVGHIAYTVFNVCLYYVKFFQDEYFVRFPHGQISVLLNDIFASSHGVLIYTVMIVQCFVYQRGSQTISNITWIILGAYLSFALVLLIFCCIGALHWLDFLYTLSYIKLACTVTKYVPQAVLNYRRKSTVGWSIENIILDLTGGVLSIMQMFINSYNYDDWQSNFGNPTKLLLGIVTIIFAIIFIVQHYCLYRHKEVAEKIPGLSESNATINTVVMIEPEIKDEKF